MAEKSEQESTSGAVEHGEGQNGGADFAALAPDLTKRIGTILEAVQREADKMLDQAREEAKRESEKVLAQARQAREAAKREADKTLAAAREEAKRESQKVLTQAREARAGAKQEAEKTLAGAREQAKTEAEKTREQAKTEAEKTLAGAREQAKMEAEKTLAGAREAAKREADKTLAGAREEAKRRVEEGRSQAEGLLAERRRRLSELSDSLLERGEHLVSQLEETEAVRERFERLMGGLGEAADRLAAEVEPGRAPAATQAGPAGGAAPDDQVWIDARQAAMQMAAAGATRGEVDAHLRDALGVADPAPVLDQIFGADTSEAAKVPWAIASAGSG
jgi:vacuolar-type H+-ATPase subunit H